MKAADDRARFGDRLAVKLTLTIGGTACSIPGGSVKELELDLRSWGFTGALTFLVQDDQDHGGGFADELLAGFVEPSLIEVALEVAPSFASPEADAVAPIVLAGLVRDRSVSEVRFRRAKDQPVLVRRYRIGFTDPAQLLWGQHFPCRLYTSKSMTDVIDDQLGERITVSYDFAALAESRRLVFLHLPRDAGASFWDFLSWYLDGCTGVLAYDYAAATYQLRSAKDDSGTAIELFGDDLEGAELRYPEIPRYAPRVLNSNADAPRTEAIEQAEAETGIRGDVLLRTPIAQDVDGAIALQRTLAALPRPEAHVRFARTPCDALVPGTLVELKAANQWSSESALCGVTWRVRRLRLSAEAPAGPLDHDLQTTDTIYRIEVQADLEQKEEPRIDRPPYRAPGYPGLVEGKVVSEQGEEGEKTYQVYRDDDTSLDEYQVKVPLWDDQVVAAPLEPILGSGNVYLPSYRAERVLLAVDVHAAKIVRLLEWRSGAPLSMDVQGQHILFGKADASQTSVNHVYDDAKPVFSVARTNAKDRSLIQLREGSLFLQVKEEEE